MDTTWLELVEDGVVKGYAALINGHLCSVTLAGTFSVLCGSLGTMGSVSDAMVETLLGRDLEFLERPTSDQLVETAKRHTTIQAIKGLT